ncbi:MAG: PAS domain S-box protein [Deltaproteobacteria bacterium]|nr:PAS domain S-box protein [Deltaproteobacteria bacterium]
MLTVPVFAGIIDCLRDPIVVKDRQHRIVLANEAFCALVRRTRQELFGKSELDILPEHQAKEVWSHDEQVFETAIAGTNDLAIVDSRGAERTFRIRRTVVPADGQALLLVSVIHDTSSISKAEQAYDESETRYRMLADATFEGIGLTEGQLVVDANDQLASMLGYSREELIGVPVQQLVAPESREQVATAIGSERKAAYEHMAMRKDGSTFPVEVRARAAVVGNRRLRVTAIRDITDRRRMEAALEQEKRTLDNIINLNPFPIQIFDKDGRFVRQNEASRAMTRSESPPPGYGLFDDPVVEKLGIREQMDKLKQGETIRGEAVWYDYSYIDPSLPSNPTCFNYISYPVKDEQGEITYLVHMLEDVTKRKRAELDRAKLEAHMRDLQKLESLGILAGGIAHDFNNLLLAITGNAELALLPLSPSAPSRENIDEILRVARRAAELCGQMLAYSGKGRFVVGRLSLSRVVQEMSQMLAVSVSRKASLRYIFSGRMPFIEADAAQLRQVIMNLIINASEALGDDAGTITVVTGEMICDRDYLSDSCVDDHLPGGRYAFVEVSDTGCGMDAQTAKRIFDPFFSTKFTGRGLGLAAVLGIVRGHRGAIKVTTTPAKGSTFQILLPAVEGEQDDPLPAEEPVARKARRRTILLVEDDPDVRQVGAKLLKYLGAEVLVANDGRQCVEVFRAHLEQIDCVILDLTMPVMNGDEAFEELRKLKKDVRVILTSGYNEVDVTQRFDGRGLAGYLQKPYGMAALVKILDDVLT